MQQKLAGQCKIFAHLFAKFKQSFAEFNKKVFARSKRRISGFHQEVLFSLNNIDNFKSESLLVGWACQSDGGIPWKYCLFLSIYSEPSLVGWADQLDGDIPWKYCVLLSINSEPSLVGWADQSDGGIPWKCRYQLSSWWEPSTNYIMEKVYR